MAEAALPLQANFQPEALLTEADTGKDVRSLRRKVQSFLYLAVKQTPDSKAPWRLPEVSVQAQGDSIREGALRAIDATFGDTAETHIFGNVPAGHLEKDGRGLFFMMGIVVDGMPQLRKGKGVYDFAWLSRGEVLEAYAGDAAAQHLFRTLLVE